MAENAAVTTDHRAARPPRLVAVVGTGTAVGKTWVTAGLARHLRTRGVPVAVRKLAQSFLPGDAAAEGTDAHVLGRASGEGPETVCPPHRWFEAALAPPMAAQALNRPPFTVAELLGELHWPGPDRCRVGLLETAGGLLSPQAEDGEGTAVLAGVQPDLVLVVADAALGVVHAVRAVVGRLAWPSVVILNRYDPSADVHRRSRHWLVERDGLIVLGLPGAGAELAQRVLG